MFLPTRINPDKPVSWGVDIFNTGIGWDWLHRRGAQHRYGCHAAAVAEDATRAEIHSSLHNHFNQERHRYNRQAFKLKRSIALSEWRQTCAV